MDTDLEETHTTSSSISSFCGSGPTTLKYSSATLSEFSRRPLASSANRSPEFLMDWNETGNMFAIKTNPEVSANPDSTRGWHTTVAYPFVDLDETGTTAMYIVVPNRTKHAKSSESSSYSFNTEDMQNFPQNLTQDSCIEFKNVDYRFVYEGSDTPTLTSQNGLSDAVSSESEKPIPRKVGTLTKIISEIVLLNVNNVAPALKRIHSECSLKEYAKKFKLLSMDNEIKSDKTILDENQNFVALPDRPTQVFTVAFGPSQDNSNCCDPCCCCNDCCCDPCCCEKDIIRIRIQKKRRKPVPRPPTPDPSLPRLRIPLRKPVREPHNPADYKKSPPPKKHRKPAWNSNPPDSPKKEKPPGRPLKETPSKENEPPPDDTTPPEQSPPAQGQKSPPAPGVKRPSAPGMKRPSTPGVKTPPPSGVMTPPPPPGTWPPPPGGTWPPPPGGTWPPPPGGTGPPPPGGTWPPPPGGTWPPPPGGTWPPPPGGTWPPQPGGTWPPPPGGTGPPPPGGTGPPPQGGAWPPPSGGAWPPPTAGSWPPTPGGVTPPQKSKNSVPGSSNPMPENFCPCQCPPPGSSWPGSNPYQFPLPNVPMPGAIGYPYPQTAPSGMPSYDPSYASPGGSKTSNSLRKALSPSRNDLTNPSQYDLQTIFASKNRSVSPKPSSTQLSKSRSFGSSGSKRPYYHNSVQPLNKSLENTYPPSPQYPYHSGYSIPPTISSSGTVLHPGSVTSPYMYPPQYSPPQGTPVGISCTREEEGRRDEVSVGKKII
ncbi:unnamed protein product [Allacma fusca]|uniref:Uncharacterized protein n=1 Tax=Allacma fusca TaxID=39272 RepID=A0A8J2MGP8_9HEXA|nr:unnamed protein product [Allacma fusca]